VVRLGRLQTPRKSGSGARRAGRCALLACVILGLLAGQGNGQDGTSCNITPTGMIEKRWVELDSWYGPLGCPKWPETPDSKGNGMRMTFRHGEIATSPKQGKNMVVAVYQQQDDLIFNWGDTDPHHYEKFIVRWDRNGVNVGQANVGETVHRTGPLAGKVRSRYVDKDRGFFSVDSPLPGRYTVYVEGCNMVVGISVCKQKFTAPVNAQYDLPDIPLYRTPAGHAYCGLQPAGFIGDRWARIGGPNESIGCPLGPEQRIGDNNARAMPFEHGEIVASPAQGEGMTVAAYQREDKLVADWGDTTPHSYEKFIVRWDRNGVNVGQQDVAGGRRGHWEKAARAGDYSVRVKGCNRSCRQEFTVPARVRLTVDRVWRPFPVDRRADFPIRDFAGPEWTTPRTVDQALTLKPARAAVAAEFVACGHELGDVVGDEDGFINTAIAKLYAANERNPANDWGTGLRRCPRSRFDLMGEVSDAIRRQEIKSLTGSTTEVPFCPRIGEYDVALRGYITLIYRFRWSLAPDVRYRLLHLLNKRGHHDRADERVCSVPESENHRLLIESSRYLTNQLWFKRTGARMYNNARNRDGAVPSMDHYLLETLQRLLQRDFVEYNSKPYQRYSFAAIQNLADYAENRKVKLAARMVLDYLSAKVAVSTADARRLVPYRRKLSYNTPDLFERHSDPLKWRFLVYTAPTLATGELDEAPHIVTLGAATEIVLAAATDYQPPKLVLDLMVNQAHRSFYQRFRHDGAEIYSSEPDFLITAGGVPAPRAYKLIGRGKRDDIGVVQSTFLMPTGQFRNVTQMIRFQGIDDERGLCVAPGFACGRNTVVPDIYKPTNRRDAPEPCWLSRPGITFIDFASPHCKDLDHREFGFYAAVFGHAGRFGFFEAVPKGKLGGKRLSEFADLTLRRNAGRTYGAKRTNTYTAWGGNTIRFDIRAKNPILSTGIRTLDAHPKNFDKWRLVSGSILNSDGQGSRKAAPATFIRIRNPFMGETLRLDFGDPFNPKRSG
jgi:hypothetical protein